MKKVTKPGVKQLVLLIPEETRDGLKCQARERGLLFSHYVTTILVEAEKRRSRKDGDSVIVGERSAYQGDGE